MSQFQIMCAFFLAIFIYIFIVSYLIEKNKRKEAIIFILSPAIIGLIFGG